jgi:glycosyltransferase involved in cell wall biosynthesis
MKRILFIGHEAGRTGAPIVLLHLLRWIGKHRPEFDVELLLLRDGDLRPEYEEVANLYVVPAERQPEIVRRGLRYLRRRFGVRKRLRIPDLEPFRSDYDLVVGNTVGSLDHLEYFKSRGLRAMCWLHEMRSVIDSFFPEPGRFREVSDSVDSFAVASRAVEKVLREFGVDKPVEIIPEFSELRPVDKDRCKEIRESLGIPASAFVVGGSGTASRRKGTDLFLEIAESLTTSIDDIYFLWVGGGPESSGYLSEIERKGLRRVFITGAQTDPENFFANMDVFALTSREDPFPLVCLEAASLAKPVICFEDAGGMPVFVGDDAGAVIPFGDVDAFAEKIHEYYHDRRRFTDAGEAAHRKVTNEFSLDVSCRKISDLIRHAAS